MQRCRNRLADASKPTFTCEPKIDGVAVALTYRDNIVIGGNAVMEQPAKTFCKCAYGCGRL